MTGESDDARRTTDPAATADAAGAGDDARRTPEPAVAADEPVPRLPRGRGLRLSRPELLRIAGLATLLVFLVVTQRPCARAVSTFVTSFGNQGSASTAMPRPGTVDLPAPPPAGSATAGSSAAVPATAGSGSARGLDRYEHLRPGMTEDEVKAVIQRARAKAGDAPD